MEAGPGLGFQKVIIFPETTIAPEHLLEHTWVEHEIPFVPLVVVAPLKNLECQKNGQTAIDLKSFAPKCIVARDLVPPFAPSRPKTIATVAELML